MVSGIRQRPGHYLALSLMMVSLSMPALMAFPAQAADAVFNLDAELTLPTCDVAVDPVVFGDIPAGVPGTWAPVADEKKEVNIHLTNCEGGVAGKTPVLTLSGTMMPGGNSMNQQFVFRSASSTSTGFGFGITKASTFTDGNDLASEINSTGPIDRKYISIPGNITAGSGPVGALDVKLLAIVQCGACDTTRSTGSLTASVTINYTYK